MDNIMRRNLGMPYISDEAVFEEQKKARKLVHELNMADPSDFDKLSRIAGNLLGGTKKNLMINPPFHCDYGFNINIGDNVFINYNCTILDVAKVEIGNNVFIAPNFSIYTAGHPVHYIARNSLYEYGIPVKICDNVWIGGSVVVNPGVTIGENSVIGSGSVVTKNIPANVIAAGNPCKVIRKITDEDIKYYYKNKEFDDEAWGKVVKNI